MQNFYIFAAKILKNFMKKSENSQRQNKISVSKKNENSFSLENLFAKKWFFPALTISLTLLFYFIFLNFANLSLFAWFGGDEWEYQSMAVNFAKGHGIQRFGGLEPFETYRFGYGDFNNTEFFMNAKGNYDFYRTPAYPFVLGLIYKIFGINVLIAKKIQLLSLCLIAASLPFLGKYFWKKTGFIAGIVASPIYIATTFKLSESLMTEAITAFAVWFIVAAYILYTYRTNIFTLCIFGFSFAFAWLVKGSLLFIPLIFFAVEFFRYFKTREKKLIRHLLIIGFSFAIFFAPWPLFIFAKTGEFHLQSTQSESLFLDTHNEFTKGWWISGCWQDKKEALFYHDNIPNTQYLKKVINFYFTFPEKIFELTVYRMLAAFSPYLFLILILALFLMESFSQIVKKFILKTENFFKIEYFLTLLVLIFLILKYPADIFDDINGKKGWLIYDFEFFNSIKPSTMYILLTLLTIPIIILRFKNSVLRNTPLIIWVIFLNFLILGTFFISTNKYMYYSRYIKVYDFAFILCFFVYFFEFSKKFLPSQVKNSL